jgi:predicted small lipoprotein YifL
MKMRALILCLTITAGCALLGGCGLKGPLYLPGKNKTQVPAPATAAPVPNQSSSGAAQQSTTAAPQSSTPATPPPSPGNTNSPSNNRPSTPPR